MRITRQLAAVLLAAAGAWIPPAFAAAPNLAVVAKACNVGSDPAVQGSTPTEIEGVVVVSPREAKCLMGKLGTELLVIQAMSDSDRQLPNANLVPDARAFNGDKEREQAVAQQYGRLSGGDKQRPLLIYCHHASCPFSLNASKHAVAAGYRNVFWLREGNEGWGKAGYGYGVGPLDAQGLPVAYAKEVPDCDSYTRKFDAEDFADAVSGMTDDVDAWQRKKTSDLSERTSRCLRKLKTKFEASAAAQDDVDKRLARAEGDALAAIRKARAAVEADPSRFFTSALSSVDLSDSKKTLADVRAVKTIRQACGSFNVPIPQVGEADEINAAIRQFNQYVACSNENRALRSPYEAVVFQGRISIYENAAKAYIGVERYTCSRWKGPNCVPDSAYARISSLFTPANHQLLSNFADRLEQMQRDNAQTGEEMDRWKERMEARLDAHNAYAQRRNSEGSQSYSGPGYQPPSYQAPAYQPPSYQVPSNAYPYHTPRSTVRSGVK